VLAPTNNANGIIREFCIVPGGRFGEFIRVRIANVGICIAMHVASIATALTAIGMREIRISVHRLTPRAAKITSAQMRKNPTGKKWGPPPMK
jgi:hypothetical protein